MCNKKMDKLLDGTRNAWANMRVESLVVDTDLEIGGDVDIDGIIEAGDINADTINADDVIAENAALTNIVSNSITINDTGSLNFGINTSITGRPTVVTGWDYGNASVNIGNVTFQNGAEFQDQIQYTKRNDTTQTLRPFIASGNLTPYIFTPRAGTGATATMNVRTFDCAGIVVMQLEYSGIAVPGAGFDDAQWDPPAGFPDRRKPSLSVKVPIYIRNLTDGAANLREDGILTIDNNARITINLIAKASGNDITFITGDIYGIEENFSFSFLRITNPS